MQNKKKIYISLMVILVVFILGTIIFVLVDKKHQSKENEIITEEVAPAKKKRISAPQNTIPADQRPFVTLTPFVKAGGRFVSINLITQIIPANRAEYEIVYDVIGASAVDANGKPIKTPTGEEEGGMQAFAGELDLTSLPTKTENRFGTCSAGGACINNSVSGGVLVLNFDAKEKYGLSSKWTYFEQGLALSKTENGDFSLEANELAKAKDFIIMEVIGLPEGLDAAIVTKPDEGKDNGFNLVAYQVAFAYPFAETEAKVNFAQADGDQMVAVWDGANWTKHKNGAKLPLADGSIYALLQQ